MQIEDLRKHWKIVLVLATLPFAYLLGERMGDISLSKSWFLWGMMAMLIYFGNSLWSSWRYSTRAFVCPTLHKSVKAPFYTIGDWAVVPVGSVDAEGFSWEGGEGTVVVPHESVETHPEFIVSYSAPKRVDFKELPSEVQSFIEGRRACGPPYYFTMTNLRPFKFETFYRAVLSKFPNPPKEEELRGLIEGEMKKIEESYKKQITRHDERFREMHTIITTQQELLADKYRSMADFADAVGTFQRSVQKEPFLKRLLTEREKRVPPE